MIYLSAQPDDTYFVWQLEIQIANLLSIGVKSSNIHVLIATKPNIGLNPDFLSLIDANQANFFVYEDTRLSKKYLSSIRPNILAQHFIKNPWLKNETIFYIDSDVFFREQINTTVFETDTWYFSDTTSYLSSSNIRKYSKSLFDNICKKVGIDPSLVIKNDLNAGGAQSIIRNVDSLFWQNVEKDCETIYEYLENYNKRVHKSGLVQSWCADMWALLWNALKINRKIQIHKELDFCWPKDHISLWYKKKILHNAGVFHAERESFFCKTLYKKETPYLVNFSNLKKGYCSQIVQNFIKKNEHTLKKLNLEDFALIIPFYSINLAQKEILDTLIRYWRKNFDIHIVVVEMGEIQILNAEKFYGSVEYHFFKEYKDIGIKTCLERIVQNIKEQYIIFSDYNIFIKIPILKKALNEVVNSSDDKVIRPYNRVETMSDNEGKMLQLTLSIDAAHTSSKSISSNNPLSGSDIFLVKRSSYLAEFGVGDFVYFDKEGINLECEIRWKILNANFIYYNEIAYRYRNYSDNYTANNIEMVKNQLLRLSSFTKEDFTNNALRHLKRNKTGKNSFTLSPIPTFVIDTSSLKNKTLKQFNNNDEFIVESLIISNPKNLWGKILKCVKHAIKRDFNLIAICSSDNNFTEVYSKKMVECVIHDMNYFNIDVLLLGSVQKLGEYNILSKNLVSANEVTGTPSLIILAKNIFLKLLDHKYLDVCSLAFNLSQLSNNMGVSYPFLSENLDLSSTKKTDVNDIETILEWEINSKKVDI
ncbi:hypothetical protein [Sphingobacterium sp.]|uniref:hypothetical protein n=1 Tax=Sphingobacterium sp. TaxID=341027 RepID=UPI0031DC2A60